VLLHGKLFKCSVHSVRPVTPVERFHHDVHSKEKCHQNEISFRLGAQS
jgi:hypothetical protein